jgi:hypothetical protein
MAEDAREEGPEDRVEHEEPDEELRGHAQNWK